MLVLGGGDGCAVRELLKYEEVERIIVVDIDAEMICIAKEHPVLLELNDSAFYDKRISFVMTDAYNYMVNENRHYDLIIADFPGPKDINLSRLYSSEFYKICYRHLRPNGILVTHATSPSLSPKSFWSIKKTIEQAGFTALPMHNFVPTFGEWGWVIGAKRDKESLRKAISKAISDDMRLNKLSFKWLDTEAMEMLFLFGKPSIDTSKIEINTIHKPVLPDYYKIANWSLY